MSCTCQMLQLQWFCRVNFQLHNHVDLFLMQQKIALGGLTFGCWFYSSDLGFAFNSQSLIFVQISPRSLSPNTLSREAPMCLRNRAVAEPSFSNACWLWVCLMLSTWGLLSPQTGTHVFYMLISNLLYSWGWPVTSHPPTSQVTEL